MLPELPPNPGRVIVRLGRHVDVALATVDLTAPQYRVLIHLCEGKEAASALADKLAVSRPSVTGVVDGLVARGLVQRQHEALDRRRVGHSLTPDGRRLLEAADAAVQHHLEEILQCGDVCGEDAFAGLGSWLMALDGYRRARHAQRIGTAS